MRANVGPTATANQTAARMTVTEARRQAAGNAIIGSGVGDGGAGAGAAAANDRIKRIGHGQAVAAASASSSEAANGPGEQTAQPPTWELSGGPFIGADINANTDAGAGAGHGGSVAAAFDLHHGYLLVGEYDFSGSGGNGDDGGGDDDLPRIEGGE